jgi:hypothetical protein
MEKIAVIEFVVFIGVVVWLFTLPSSPLHRDKAEADNSADPSDEQKPD